MLSWAKENNLGPEVPTFFRRKSENLGVSGPFLDFRTFLYREMWMRCCQGGPCISLSGVRSGRMSSQVDKIPFKSGFHYLSHLEKSFQRSPMDATWEPWSSAPHRFPCTCTASYLQSAHYLQGLSHKSSYSIFLCKKGIKYNDFIPSICFKSSLCVMNWKR